MSFIKKPRKQAGIPPVPASLPPEQRQFFQAIRENLAVRMGQEGDPLERALVLRDFLEGGGLGGSLTGSGGTGLGGFPSTRPTNPDLDYSLPPAPTGVQTSGGFNLIFLVWDNTAGYYPAYAEVYRSTEDALDLSSAEMKLVGLSQGTQYVDYLDGQRTVYYYWVRFVKVVGNQLIYGAFNQTAGTPGQLSLDPDYVVGLLEGQLTENELAAELLTPIQAIPTIQSALANYGGRIQSTEAALSDLLNVPAYDSTETYVIDDLASYNGSTWRALAAMSDPVPLPVEGANWTEVGRYVTFSDIIAANAVSIDDLDIRITTSEGTLTSYGTDITALQNRVTDTEDSTSGNSTAISTLDSRVTVTENGISANSSDITLLENSVTTAQGDITATSDALSLLDARVVATNDTVTAHSSDITQLQTDVSNLDSEGNAQALSALDVRVTSNEDGLTAQASDITMLQAGVDDNSAAVQTKADAQVVTDLSGEVTSIKARYSIQLDVNGRMSGLIFGDNGTQSSLVVAANEMYFIDPGQSITPFNPATNYSSMDAARDTQLVFGYARVEGQNRFVINAPAYIPEGYITSGQVGAIGFGKIQDSNGEPVTTVAGKLKAQNIDVDNLVAVQAKSASHSPGTAGWIARADGFFEAMNARINGHVEMDTGYIASGVSIGGLGSFAYKSSLFYNEVSGTKPPPNADNTGSNTSANTNAVAGTAATTVRDQAAGAGATATRVNNWVKPNSTLIDGNKIFTGDAYVDTLQIAGNAVTVTVAKQKNSNMGSVNSANWKTYESFNYGHADPNNTMPVIMFYKTTGDHTEGDYVGKYIRFLFGGSQVHYMDVTSSYFSSGGWVTLYLAPGVRLFELQFRSGRTNGDPTFLSSDIILFGAAR